MDDMPSIATQYRFHDVGEEIAREWPQTLSEALDEALVPLLEKHAAATAHLRVGLATSDAGRLRATAYLHLPGRKTVSVTAEHREPTELARRLARSLFRQAKRHFDRLRAQREHTRRSRRERLRTLRAEAAALPEPTVDEATITLRALLPRLETVARRELAYLHATGDLPSDYPAVSDVVDEALAATTAAWQAETDEQPAYVRLLRNLFAAIDREVVASRTYGEAVSLESPLPPDAEDTAEAMVEEEFYEYYQPDDTLSLADVIPEEPVDETATDDELDELGERRSERAYALAALKDLPTPWRRAFLLVRVDGLDIRSVTHVLRSPAEEERVRRSLAQAEEFVAARIEDAGIASDGAAWLASQDWSQGTTMSDDTASLPRPSEP
ncbi:MAG: hypothetical protein KatS3mg012_2524 [Gaiellaceae bacterium]|nr:MAG: hypothetical protein KatS3mg012_2524 [Gaiellaceae bacterium]